RRPRPMPVGLRRRRQPGQPPGEQRQQPEMLDAAAAPAPPCAIMFIPARGPALSTEQFMSRDAAIQRAMQIFDDGTFLEILGRRVAIPTESQNPDRLPDLQRYLDEEIEPSFAKMGHTSRTYANPVAGG